MSRIAVGSFAEVFAGRFNGALVVIKIVLRVESALQACFKTEAPRLASLRHPNLLRMIGYTIRPAPAMVSEYMARGSLFQMLRSSGNKPLKPTLLRSVAVSVARGMAYLHEHKPPIMHTALKSPNILVSDDFCIKVADFGLSHVRHCSMVVSAMGPGTPEWMAPEVLRGEPFALEADVYSYGVILWECLTGRRPWAELESSLQVVGAVGFRDKVLPQPVGDPALVGLCMRCLAADPAARPSFQDILDELEAMHSHQRCHPPAEQSLRALHGSDSWSARQHERQPSLQQTPAGCVGEPTFHAEGDSRGSETRDLSPAALYFCTNVVAAEPKPPADISPAVQTDIEILEAVRSGRLSLDVSRAMCTGKQLDSQHSAGSCAETTGEPAADSQKAGEQGGVPQSMAASVTPSQETRAGETPFEMAALSSPFSSGGSTAGSSSMTPAVSHPQSSSEPHSSAEQPAAAAQQAAAPASDAMSAFKSPFEMIAESAVPFGDSLPAPADSAPAPANANGGQSAGAGARRGPDSVKELNPELSVGELSLNCSQSSQQSRSPEQRSQSIGSGISASHGEHPPSAASSPGGSSHVEGGYLSRQELSARLSMLKTAQTRRLLSRSAAAQTSGRLDPDHNDAGVDDDDSEVSVASQRDAATHHAEAAVMAAYRRRSVERRSADIPRALEAIAEGASR